MLKLKKTAKKVHKTEMDISGGEKKMSEANKYAWQRLPIKKLIFLLWFDYV